MTKHRNDVSAFCYRFVATIALLAGAVCSDANAEIASVDYASTYGPITHNGSGVLHSISPTAPDDSLITPINPSLFRAFPWATHYDRAVAHNAAYQLVVSDLYNANTPYPGDNGDWSQWEQTCRDLATQALADGHDIHFDLWNEPDTPAFWPGGRSDEQFLETWRRGVNAMRSVNPNVTIVGPSATMFDHASIYLGVERFLTYAKANDVLPDIISWHSWQHSLNEEITQLNYFGAANNIDVSRISINEYLWATDEYHAGSVVYWLDSIERNRVESSARSCWTTCFNTTLDGLVTDGGQPRSTWWVYERYNQMTGSTALTVPGATMDTVASQDTGVAHALIGRCSSTPQSSACNIGPGPAQVRLQNLDDVSNLLSNGQVHVLAELIDNSDTAASSGPITMIDGVYAVTNGQLLLTLPAFGAWDAYYLTLSTVAPGTLAGDFNHDGAVDAADYVLIRNIGGDEAALSVWRSNFGQTLGGGSAVPEPSTALLCAGMSSLLAFCSRRR